MYSIETEGARIYYEQMGQGPVLIMIPGASGTNESYKSAAELLKHHFTVVLPDRRGFGYSELTKALPASINRPMDTFRLKQDADDIAKLARAVSNEPVFLFGTDTGAVAGIHLLETNPELVEKACFHEPLNLSAFPEKETLIQEIETITQAAQIEGVPAAMRIYERIVTLSKQDMKSLVEHTIAPCAICSPDVMQLRSRESTQIWLQYELRQYSSYETIFEKLRLISDKLVWLKGKASEGLMHKAAEQFAVMTGGQAIEIAGGHYGYAQAPFEFAEGIIENVLK